MINTGKMNIVLRDELEERFRRAVFENKGMKKGNISVALEEAIEQWIRTCKGMDSIGKRKKEQ